MNSNIITCPHCDKEISIDSVLRKQTEETIRKEIQSEEGDKYQKMLEEALRKHEEEKNDENKLLKSRLDEMQEKNKELKEKEIAFLTEKQKLKDREEELNLEIKKKVIEAENKAREETLEKAKEDSRHKEADYEQKNAILKRQVDELQLKLQQGSQQLQGESFEAELEQLLKTEFPQDDIKPVPKGMSGADVVQTIYDSYGHKTGVIIWESKRAKDFGKDWINKLKMNSVEINADVAILVSTVLPDGIKNFGPKDGVYVTGFNCVKEVVRLIRGTLVKIYKTKQENVGKNEKMEVVWSYLTSNQFSQKFALIVENFIAEKDQIERERRAYSRIWADREKRLERIINTSAMIYGDLQGLTNSSLPQIKGFELDNIELVETTQIQFTDDTATLVQTTIETETFKES